MSARRTVLDNNDATAPPQHAHGFTQCLRRLFAADNTWSKLTASKARLEGQLVHVAAFEHAMIQACAMHLGARYA
jgi:hypothetical protein